MICKQHTGVRKSLQCLIAGSAPLMFQRIASPIHRALWFPLLIGVIYGSVVCSAAAAGNGEVETLTDRAIQQAAALVAPSVVRIDTVGGRDQLEPGLVSSGATTGLVISSDGYLVSSAFHFAAQPASIIVTLPDGRRLAGRLIATDRQRMVTLLKIDADRLQLPTAAPSDSFRVGQWAIALGKTYDAETPSLSVGIVSALNRIWGKAIQTDAKISPVNYGGPLVDIQGRVMGLLVPLSPQESSETAGVEWYDSGIGFAVPLADILEVTDRLKAGSDLLPGLLGIAFKGKNLIEGEPLIDTVRFGSPAEKAGLLPGDKVATVEGIAITRLAEFKQVLGRKYAGDSLRLAVARGEQTIGIELELVGTLPPYVPPYLGVQLARYPAGELPSVRMVIDGSPASRAGLQPQDVILRWNDVEVANTESLSEQLHKHQPGQTVSLTVRRGTDSMAVGVTLGNPSTDVPAEVASQAPFGQVARPDDLKVGRIAATLPGFDRDVWLYVPESYRADMPQSVVVFLHPSSNPMEQPVLSAWRAECERRGMILLAPQANAAGGWTPNDLEFLQGALQDVRDKYTVAAERIVVVGLGNAAPIAGLWAFRQPEVIRGLALIDSPALGKVPENDPERRLSIYSLSRGRGVDAAKWVPAITTLRKAGYPAVLRQLEEPAGGYPSAETNAELARWVELLDAL